MHDRVDLALARTIADVAGGDEALLARAQGYHDRLYRPAAADPALLAALLRLRGLTMFDGDAVDLLAGNSRRFLPSSQESQLLFGLTDGLQMLRDRASQGRPPDGWFLVEVFKVVTRGLQRFRNNTLRADQPWDGLLYVHHPAPTELTALLDSFDYPHRYRDNPVLFDRLHPLRQGYRILWRFGRIAPFPDFNLPMAWLAMCSWMLAKGYPVLRPEAADRDLVSRLLAGPPPSRVLQWEARLLSTLGG
jgi:hypothetical protein